MEYYVGSFLVLERSHGYDIFNGSSHIVKEIAPILTEPFIYLLNKCIIEGVFSNNFKISRVVPIHRSGNYKYN